MPATRIVELLQLLAAYPCVFFPDCKEDPFRELDPFLFYVFDGLISVAVIFVFHSVTSRWEDE